MYELDLSIELPLLLGDMNGDSVVDVFDVPLFVQALVDRGAYDANGFPVDADISGDVDGSGIFDLGDLGPFNGMFSAATATAQSVPEPSSWVLILLGAAGVVASLRRR